MKQTEARGLPFGTTRREGADATRDAVARRWPIFLLLAITLGGCAAAADGPRYDPLRCDRNGDETQRRAC